MNSEKLKACPRGTLRKSGVKNEKSCKQQAVSLNMKNNKYPSIEFQACSLLLIACSQISEPLNLLTNEFETFLKKPLHKCAV